MASQSVLFDEFVSNLRDYKNGIKSFNEHPGPHEFDIKLAVDTPNKKSVDIIVRISYKQNFAVFSYAVPSLKLFAQEEISKNADIYTSKLFGPLYQLSKALPGNRVEVDTYYHKNDPRAGYLYWDTWYGSVGPVYDEQIHPKLIETILNYQDFLPEKGLMLDLFCGDGRFVAKLVKESKKIGRYKVKLIDYHQPSLQIAKQLFTENRNVDVLPAINIASRAFSLTKFSDRVSAVTIVGGLCSGVLLREEAVKLMKQVYKALAPGGLCFITGYTATLLNSTHFKKIGFKVEQSSVPENALIVRHPYQMYVLKKTN